MNTDPNPNSDANPNNPNNLLEIDNNLTGIQRSDRVAFYTSLPTNESSYRQFHSTETALLKVHNAIFLNMDQQEVTLWSFLI